MCTFLLQNGALWEGGHMTIKISQITNNCLYNSLWTQTTECIVGYLSDASWDMRDWFIRTYAIFSVTSVLVTTTLLMRCMLSQIAAYLPVHRHRYMRSGIVGVRHEPGMKIVWLTLNVRGPIYLGLTRSISWLLTSPGHQQPWYWLCRICRSWSYLRILSTCFISMWSNDIKCKYVFRFPLQNLACKELRNI